MAGGRRPASYVSGTRHTVGVERSAVHERPVTPPVGSTPGPSLPLWIPSIWQPPPLNASSQQSYATDAAIPPAPPRGCGDGKGDASTALAAALDSAVQSAVVRALGQAPNPGSPHMRTTPSVSDHGAEEAEAALAMRERELTNMVDSLQAQLDERNADVRKLADQLHAMEQRLTVESEQGRKREERLARDLNVHVNKLTASIAESEQRLDARISSVHEQVKANQSGVNKLRTAQKSNETETRSLKKCAQELSGEMRQLEISLCSEIEKSWCQVEQFGHTFNEALAKVNDIEKDEEPSVDAKDVEEMKHSLEATVESVVALRSKLKRVETQIGEAAKQTNDMMALNNGFQEGMRENLVKVTNAIEGLGSSVTHLRGQIVNCDDAEQKGDVQTRLDGLEANVKALKKLIESNLRTQVSAESIVKEQVSLITKHVCVAMRQYTARRISENNCLIDRALRARVPEYAKNEDQFVLVREQHTDGDDESVDIRRASEVSSTASS